MRQHPPFEVSAERVDFATRALNVTIAIRVNLQRALVRGFGGGGPSEPISNAHLPTPHKAKTPHGLKHTLRRGNRRVAVWHPVLPGICVLSPSQPSTVERGKDHVSRFKIDHEAMLEGLVAS